MENSAEADQKIIKARSYVGAPSYKLRSEPSKRKSYNVNDAMKSLDMELGRLKKSKLVNGECVTVASSRMGALRSPHANMFMDVSSDCTFGASGYDNASMMSMNFSHYELARNLSNTQCNSEGANSGNTSNTCCVNSVNASDSNVRNEHLERYFRSAEMWSKRFRDVGPSRSLLPDK